MNASDGLRLRHMLDSARAAVLFIHGETRASLDTDLKLVFALVRAVEIIGEAAASISMATREQFTDVPWKSMIGMRNVLIHDYFDVDLDQVWDTVTKNLPALISQLETILETGSS